MKQVIKIRVPEQHLGDVSPEDLPPYLVPVRAAADALLGMALHPGDEGRRIILEVTEAAVRKLNAVISELGPVVVGHGYVDYPEPDQTYGAADG